jgi:hypothetical protein
MSHAFDRTQGSRQGHLIRFSTGCAAAAIALLLFDAARALWQTIDYVTPSVWLFKALALLAGAAGLAGFIAGIALGTLAFALLARIRSKLAVQLAKWVLRGGLLLIAVALATVHIPLVLLPDGLAPRPQARTETPHSTAPPPPNILLIISDSLRQDLFAQVTSTALAPNLQRFASEATSYTNCIAVCSWTRPSVAGMLTGLYPSSLGVHHSNLPAHATLLAELLHDAGYETLAVVDNNLISPRAGFAQGHDYFWQKNNAIVLGHMAFVYRVLGSTRIRSWLMRTFHLMYEGAPTVNERVRALLKKRDRSRPFFMLIHYMDTHYPY